MNTPETDYQLALLEQMIVTRMDEAGETREQACKHLGDFFRRTLNEKLDTKFNYDTSGK